MDLASGGRIVTLPSCSNATADHAGSVIVSGSYGGKYNAFNAAKWGIRGVVMNDAGVGSEQAGIVGLAYLDLIGLPAATASAMSCHIGDGDHTFAHGVVSFVNQSAAALGCFVGEAVRASAQRMLSGSIPGARPLPITEGVRVTIRDTPGQPKLICADSVGMVLPEDAGQIVVTASHAALPGGRPDKLIPPAIHAIFFSDAGIGMDEAGIARLPVLDRAGVIAGVVSASSAPIGDARALYTRGVLSHLTSAGIKAGGKPGMLLRLFVNRLLSDAGGESEGHQPSISDERHNTGNALSNRSRLSRN
jgi:hypothetical protein